MKDIDIYSKVLDIETAIKSYFEELNRQGVWMFLACLGALSLPSQALKVIAFSIILIMVFIELSKTRAWFLAGNNNFKQTLERYSQSVKESELQEEYKQILQNRLVYLERTYFSFGWTSLRIGSNFILGMIFLACSIIYMVKFDG